MQSKINKLVNYGTIFDTYPLYGRYLVMKGNAYHSNEYRHITAMAMVIFVFLSFLLVLSAPACAGTPSIEELTSRLQSVYEATADMQADFQQEVTIKSMKKTEREEGRVWMKNPQMMYWDYKKPKIKKLVINAKKAWLYVEEDRVVYLQNADAVYSSRLVIKFLSGIGKLSEDFVVDFAKKGPTNPDGDYLLTLRARDKAAGIDTINLTIHKKTFQITHCRFEDDYGNITSLSFRNIRINTGIPGSFFTFKPTSDMEVVNMP